MRSPRNRLQLVATLLLVLAGCGTPAPQAPQPLKYLVGGVQAFGIAVDATTVYVSRLDRALILAIPVNGGTYTDLGVSASGRRPAVDDRRLYWADGNSLLACDKSNCVASVVRLAFSASKVWDIVVDATNVYWSTVDTSITPSTSLIMKIDKNGGTPFDDTPSSDGGQPAASGAAGDGGTSAIQLAAARRPTIIAVDATSVYWLDDYTPNAGVMKVPIAGGSAVQLSIADPIEPSGLAIDDDNVYYADGAGDVFKVSKDGGTTHVVLSQIGEFPSDLATDGQHLYVATDTKLLSVPLVGGGFPVALATGLQGAGYLALDDTSVYMTTLGNGDVIQVPK